MSIRTKSGHGKLTGKATIIRKDGTKEEAILTAEVPKERVEEFLNSPAVQVRFNSKTVDKAILISPR